MSTRTPPMLSLSDLNARVRSTSPEELERRYRRCLRGGHVWRPVAEHPFGTASPAEYCPACLRVRLGTFEGWPSNQSGCSVL